MPDFNASAQKARRPRTVGRRCNTWLLAVLLCCGCSFNTFRANNDDDVPNRYKIEEEHVVLHSDVKLDADDPMIQELLELRKQIGQTLDLELGDKQVEVYLFKDEPSYHKFLAQKYPGLPPRRAYFVGTSSKLAVYTVWSDRIREDLRHEFTHGVLHGALSYVPLWLDEGFAEYFEQPRAAGTPREDYLTDLVRLQQNGWTPNLQRLEYLEGVSEMQRLDYAESWAWVHWMLHHTPQTRSILLEYTHQPRRAQSVPLHQRLRQFDPQPERSLNAWIASSKGVATP